jgi:hypothetical protein
VAVDVILPQLPAGIAVEDGFPAEGKLLKIAIREFSSSEDGDAFIRRLEGLPNQLLMMVSATMNPSTVDHLVAIIRTDRTARVFINECNVFVRARVNRSFKAGEPAFESDFVDIDSLIFEGVEFPVDAGVVCVFSAGWRKGLFLDLGPLGPEHEPRAYDVPKQLGSYMAYLRSQGVFHLVQDDWDYLIERQWFPFVSLSPQVRLKLVRFARGRLPLDALLPEAKAAVIPCLPQMLERWRASNFCRPHFDLLAHATRRFEDDDYMSCTAIVYPRIEGLMRTLHQSLGSDEKATQKNLTSTVISARAAEHHDFNLLIPDMFRRYLDDAYFASFKPGQPSTLSRNSVGHGVAAPEQFDEKAALMGLLTLDQLYFFLPAIDADEPLSTPAP